MMLSTSVQRWCVWGGIAFSVLWVIGFLLAGFVPPPSPANSAEDIARIYAESPNLIRTGLLLTLVGVPFMFPFVTVISLQLKRIEGSSAPCAYVQFASGATGAMIFAFPIMMLQAAAFRPAERDVQVTQGLSDAAWITLVGLVTLALIQNAAIAVAILRDGRAEPVFPRWVAYFNIWVAVLFVPGGFLVYFHDGPLAWDGVFSFWIPGAVFLLWFLVMTVMLRRAVEQEEAEARAAVVPAAGPSVA